MVQTHPHMSADKSSSDENTRQNTPGAFVFVNQVDPTSPKRQHQHQLRNAQINAHIAKFAHRQRRVRQKQEHVAYERVGSPESSRQGSPSSSISLLSERTGEQPARDETPETPSTSDLASPRSTSLLPSPIPNLRYIQNAGSDPFHAYGEAIDPSDVLECNDFHWNVPGPANSGIANVFGVANILGFSPLNATMQPIYWHALASVVTVTKRGMIDTTPHLVTAPLKYYAQALVELKRRLVNPEVNTDNMSMMVVIILAQVAMLVHNHTALQTHRECLARMVQSRGGLDALINEGPLRAAIIDWDGYWMIQTGVTFYSEERAKYQSVYIDSFGIIQETLTQQLPVGFHALANNKQLSINAIEVLLAVKSVTADQTLLLGPPRDVLSVVRVRKKSWETIFDACPSLNTLLNPEKPSMEAWILLTVILFYCRALTSYHTVFGKYNAVRERLSRAAMYWLQEGHSKSSQAERSCWIWICMVVIESWRSCTGYLENRAQIILRLLIYPKPISDVLGLAQASADALARQYFWTDELAQSFRTCWEGVKRQPSGEAFS